MRSRRKNKFFFNMVEILLAIGVLAIGFSAILGLFPVAIKMVRSSQTETLVADAVGDLQSYYYSMANIPLVDGSGNHTNGEYWYALLFYPESSPRRTGLPSYSIKFHEAADLDGTVRPAAATAGPTMLYGPGFLDKLKAAIEDGVDLTSSTDSDALELGLIPNLNLFRPPLTGHYQTFYLVNGEDNFKRITSTAQLLIWTSKMAKFNSIVDTANGYEDGVILNIEASWPINVPYAEREKRFYQFIIANPKKIN